MITMTLQLKVTISHKNLFLPVKYCMSHTVITHNIPIFMTRFWHANCMARLGGHRTLLWCADNNNQYTNKDYFWAMIACTNAEQPPEN